MQSSGDIVNLDLGQPEGPEAGDIHPAVVVTAQRILDAALTVIQVVPLTSTLRGFTLGNVGPPALRQIRETIAVIIDLP